MQLATTQGRTKTKAKGKATARGKANTKAKVKTAKPGSAKPGSAKPRGVELTGPRDGVLESMRKLGFPIAAKVEVVLDPELAIMGYTRPVRGGFRITVSQRAVQSGELTMLLSHELSHVYRMTTGHPSHDDKAIQAAYATLRVADRWEPYMEETLHDIVNNVEDLYADGIAFEVVKAQGLFRPDHLGEFLQGWMSDEVPEGEDARHTRWLAAHAMLGNARSLAQLDRMGLKDAFAKASKRNGLLLAQLPKGMAREFPYFCKLLRDLREETTPAEFQELLVDYMQAFVALAEGRPLERKARRIA